MSGVWREMYQNCLYEERWHILCPARKCVRRKKERKKDRKKEVRNVIEDIVRRLIYRASDVTLGQPEVQNCVVCSPLKRLSRNQDQNLVTTVLGLLGAYNQILVCIEFKWVGGEC
jgi:hypothetical protein